MSHAPSDANRPIEKRHPEGEQTGTDSDTRPAEFPAFPTSGRLLGLDFGTKRVGIAVSNTEQTIASPLDVYQVQSPQQDARYLQKIAAEYEVVGLVVGLPVHMSGEESQKSREARAFGKWVSEATKLPVAFHDERYTSSIAESYLLSAELSKKKRKARIDKLAAQILLQSYLDATNREDPPADWHENRP